MTYDNTLKITEQKESKINRKDFQKKTKIQNKNYKGKSLIADPTKEELEKIIGKNATIKKNGIPRLELYGPSKKGH